MILTIFDIDGTICDSREAEGICFAKAIERITGNIVTTLDWTQYPEPTSSGVVRSLLEGDPAASEVEAILARFIQSEMANNLMLDARVMKMTNNASFPDLPDYPFIANYKSEADGIIAMERMKQRFHEEPHASLMRMISEFRVAFSEELNIKAEQATRDSANKPCV